MQFPQHLPTNTGEDYRDKHDCVFAESYDDDEAFWSQAADVVEGKAWEGGGGEKEGDDDSAFIDELLSSGLIVTPQVQSHHTTPHRDHHSSPHIHPSPCTTPLSHRHAEGGKIHVLPHPLF